MSAIPVPKARRPIPPLENGDRLTRDEFARRFDATPGLKKAELLVGIVFMPPPVSHTYHSHPHVNLGMVLANFGAATPGVEAGAEGSLRMNLNDMPQPDLY